MVLRLVFWGFNYGISHPQGFFGYRFLYRISFSFERMLLVCCFDVSLWEKKVRLSNVID